MMAWHSIYLPRCARPAAPPRPCWPPRLCRSPEDNNGFWEHLYSGTSPDRARNLHTLGEQQGMSAEHASWMCPQSWTGGNVVFVAFVPALLPSAGCGVGLSAGWAVGFGAGWAVGFRAGCDVGLGVGCQTFVLLLQMHLTGVIHQTGKGIMSTGKGKKSGYLQIILCDQKQANISNTYR